MQEGREEKTGNSCLIPYQAPVRDQPFGMASLAAGAAGAPAGQVRVRMKWAGSASKFRPLSFPTGSTCTEAAAEAASIWGLDVDSVHAFGVLSADVDAVDGHAVDASAVPSHWLRMTASAPLVDCAWVVVFGHQLALPESTSLLGAGEGETELHCISYTARVSMESVRVVLIICTCSIFSSYLQQLEVAREVETKALVLVSLSLVRS